MTNQNPQKPETTEKNRDPQHKPDQLGKDKKDQYGKDKENQNQPARSDESKRMK